MIVVALFLAASCGKKKEDAAAPPATQDPNPPAIDCATLVTAADLEAACGAKLEVTAKHESGAFTCMIDASTQTEQILFYLTSERTPDQAERTMKGKMEVGAKQPNFTTRPVEGVGDHAMMSQYDVGETASRYTIAMQKGRFVFVAQGSVLKTSPKPCSVEQTTALLKAIAGRIP